MPSKSMKRAGKYRMVTGRMMKVEGGSIRYKGAWIDMPKKQPCPECGKASKRIQSLPVGAVYQCPNDGGFLMRRPDHTPDGVSKTEVGV